MVCTKNSASGIEQCLNSLIQSDIGELIVVDASSTDGTREIALKYGSLLLDDTGVGLGNARNIGIARTEKPLILNMGSDNIVPHGELQKMINYLEQGSFQGVSAQTSVEGVGFIARGLNAWRQGRFSEGQRSVIGTPTLFIGELLRMNPYDPLTKFSDDSELCERWAKEFDAQFAISDAIFLEVGKTTWCEVKIRANMYGISDHEIYTRNSPQRNLKENLISISHPVRVDLIEPSFRLPTRRLPSALPFFAIFTIYRYMGWLKSIFK